MQWSYEALLARLTDMRALAKRAADGEHSGCCSSFDRRSRYDEAQGHYVNWDANDDGTGYVRKLQDGSIVAAELEGPGVIWRSWSAMPAQGAMRVYVDGELIINRPFMEHFTRFGDDFAPMNLPSLCPQLSRGCNCFLPIPFNRSLRIELAPEWGMYYHFTYTCFPAGDTMPAYQEMRSKAGRIALAKLDRALYGRGGECTLPMQVQLLPPHKEQTLYLREGSGALTRMELRFEADAMKQAQQITVRMYWDGQDKPAVCAPACDLFAATPTAASFRTVPCGKQGSTYYQTWHMPFAKGARVTLTNETEATIQAEAAFCEEACADASTLLRFCAQHHGDDPQFAQEPAFAQGGERWPDWLVLSVKGGAGRFCGMHLRVRDTFAYPNAQQAQDWWFGFGGDPRLDWWWGEGDEKFFVDGETFPSTFGTGSEDYFGYAWAAEPPFALFDSAFAAMSDMPLDGNGDTSVCRFHIADNIPFQKGFEAFMEKYKGNTWGDNGECRYKVTPYWYQEAEMPLPLSDKERDS